MKMKIEDFGTPQYSPRNTKFYAEKPIQWFVKF